jgi:hypothetical protein
MALAGKSGVERDIDNRLIAIDQQLLGAFDPPRQDELVRCCAVPAAEGAGKIERRNAGDVRELFDAEILVERRFDVIEGALQSRRG